ncbi:hypothetical protein BDV33DRAFT_169953 [Aspergillus novoparasiticus]|uniref:Uncharacterized protein n=1 Tax=Aspergillus novoparasiticus TaxID=986946 RepID=A0A5N6EXU5_9EURO|nr:hypothetical protein BDV33DRAFT_169953 [Aspergillus novoparasiticus]
MILSRRSVQVYTKSLNRCGAPHQVFPASMLGGSVQMRHSYLDRARESRRRGNFHEANVCWCCALDSEQFIFPVQLSDFVTIPRIGVD